MCGTEELGLDEGKITDVELRRWSSTGIGGTLVTLLSFGDLRAECSMELLEIDGEFLSSS